MSPSCVAEHSGREKADSMESGAAVARGGCYRCQEITSIDTMSADAIWTVVAGRTSWFGASDNVLPEHAADNEAVEVRGVDRDLRRTSSQPRASRRCRDGWPQHPDGRSPTPAVGLTHEFDRCRGPWRRRPRAMSRHPLPRSLTAAICIAAIALAWGADDGDDADRLALPVRLLHGRTRQPDDGAAVPRPVRRRLPAGCRTSG